MYILLFSAELQASEVTIQWNPTTKNSLGNPLTVPIKHYVVQYRRTSDSAWSQDAPVKLAKARVTNLYPNQDYYFRVYAVDYNNVKSLPSSQIQLFVPDGAPPLPTWTPSNTPTATRTPTATQTRTPTPSPSLPPLGPTINPVPVKPTQTQVLPGEKTRVPNFTLTPGGGNPRPAAKKVPLDFNGDGISEIALIAESKRKFSYLTDSPEFPELTLGNVVPGSVAANGHYDNDNKYDLGSIYRSINTIYWNTGSRINRIKSSATLAISGCDFNADGLSDIALVEGSRVRLVTLKLKGIKIKSINLSDTANIENYSCGDTNGDGTDELLFQRIETIKELTDNKGYALNAYVLRSLSLNGRSEIVKVLGAENSSRLESYYTVPDLDGDGVAEIIASRKKANKLSLMLKDRDITVSVPDLSDFTLGYLTEERILSAIAITADNLISILNIGDNNPLLFSLEEILGGREESFKRLKLLKAINTLTLKESSKTKVVKSKRLIKRASSAHKID